MALKLTEVAHVPAESNAGEVGYPGASLVSARVFAPAQT